MSESPEKRSSGKHSETQQINASRNLIKGLFAGIAVGLVAGFFLGKQVGDEDKKPGDNKPVPCTITPDDKPSLAYETLRKRIDEMNKIKKAIPKWDSKDTEVCEMSDDEVLDEAKEICREEVLEFARAIGITDKYDIDRMVSTCLQGYKIEGFTHTRNGKQMIKFSRLSTYTLGDAGMEDIEDRVVLTEEINEDTISGEHRAPEDNSLSPEEKDLNEKIKNGDNKGIVDSLNSQKVLDAARNDAEMRELLSGLIKIATEARDIVLSDNTDPEIKIATACGLPFKLDKYLSSFPENVTDKLFEVPEYMQFLYYLMEYFTEALPALAGLEEVDSYECAKGLSDIVDKCIQGRLGNKF